MNSFFKDSEQKMKVRFTSDSDFYVVEVPKGEFSFVKDATNNLDALQIK